MFLHWCKRHLEYFLRSGYIKYSKCQMSADELHCCSYRQLNSLSDDAESLKLLTFMGFPFRVVENRKSALSEKMDIISQTWTNRGMSDMNVHHRPCSHDLAPSDHCVLPRTKMELSSINFDSDDEVIAAVNHFLKVLDTDFCKEGIHCFRITGLSL